jgi:hypothetical protein
METSEASLAHGGREKMKINGGFTAIMSTMGRNQGGLSLLKLVLRGGMVMMLVKCMLRRMAWLRILCI